MFVRRNGSIATDVLRRAALALFGAGLASCGEEGPPPYVVTREWPTDAHADAEAVDGAVGGDAGEGDAQCMPNQGLVLISEDGGVIIGCVARDRVQDVDCDGFTEGAGDCNDCDAATNPGALDVPGNEQDDDCNGSVDDTSTTCDRELAGDSDDPFDAAKAIGLCHRAQGDGWGLLDAEYLRADGSRGPASIGHGLLREFGPHVPSWEGERMLVLSSGTARTPGAEDFSAPDGYDHGTSSATPAGYPMDFPSCAVQTADNAVANDPVALALTLRMPTNARGFRFKFNFYTFEYPVFVCSVFNDYFVVLQAPAPDQALRGNISFDAKKNPVSVNIGFMEVCEPMTIGDRMFPCERGTAGLDGTGFEGHGATGWLETESPAAPGSTITLRFAIWDVGDHDWDSSVLIDGFEFVLDEIEVPRTVQAPDAPE